MCHTFALLMCIQWVQKYNNLVDFNVISVVGPIIEVYKVLISIARPHTRTSTCYRHLHAIQMVRSMDFTYFVPQC